MAKRAVLVGCNYPGTEATLRGCVNDVKAIKALLINHKVYDDMYISLLSVFFFFFFFYHKLMHVSGTLLINEQSNKERD